MVNPDDVDVYTSWKIGKRPEKHKYEQPTENQKTTNIKTKGKGKDSIWIWAPVTLLLIYRIRKDATHFIWNYQFLRHFSKYCKIFSSTEPVLFLRNYNFYCLPFIFSRTIRLFQSRTEGRCCSVQFLKYYNYCSFMFVWANVWLTTTLRKGNKKTKTFVA